MLFTTHIPYTYIIGWSKLNVWYYGCRWAKNCHPSDFWKEYFTSSTHVSQFRLEHGDPDIKQVRRTFTDTDHSVRVRKCQLWEDKAIKRIGAIKNPQWLNKSNAGRDFHCDTSGYTIAKNTLTGDTIFIPITEFKSSDNLVGVNSGISHKTSACCHCGRQIGINNTKRHEDTCQLNPNRIPGPLAGRKLNLKIKSCCHCGRTGAKHAISRHEKMCPKNPNPIPHSSTGQKYSINHGTCQFCGKQGSLSGITRHETACLSNPDRKVRKNKPRSP